MTGKRPSALTRLNAAKPVPAPGVEPPPVEPSAAAPPPPATVTPSRRRDGATARRQAKYTVIVSGQMVSAFDRLALDMSDRTGRRVEKAEIVRALIAAAAEPVPAVQTALLDAIATEQYRETRHP
jgi:hypothetical protein